MKKIYIGIILGVFFLSANQVFALDYREDFSSDTVYTNVSNEDISEAKLLESYITRYKDNLEVTLAKLGLEDSKDIQRTYELLELMKLRTQQIQLSYIDGNKTSDILKSIVQDLKDLNSALKKIIQQKEVEIQNTLKKKKDIYSRFSKKFSDQVDIIIEKITRVLLSQEKLSEKQKDIVRVLVKIQKENTKLKQFSSSSFSDEESMKEYLKKSILKIQSYFEDLKKLSR